MRKYNQIEGNKEVYENPKEMSEILYMNFQKVFTTESDFERSQDKRLKKKK